MEFACSCPAAHAAWTLKPLLVPHAKPNSLHDSRDSPETTTRTKAGKGHMADKAEDKAGNASRGGRSTDQLLADILNTVATAGSSNSSDTADTAGIPDHIDHRSKDKVHRPVLLSQGCVREAGRRPRLPGKKSSSSFCPFSSCLIRNFNRARYMPAEPALAPVVTSRSWRRTRPPTSWFSFTTAHLRAKRSEPSK